MILYSGMWEHVFGPDGAAVMSSGHLEVNKQTRQKSEEEVVRSGSWNNTAISPPQLPSKQRK